MRGMIKVLTNPFRKANCMDSLLSSFRHPQIFGFHGQNLPRSLQCSGNWQIASGQILESFANIERKSDEQGGLDRWRNTRVSQ